MDLITALAAACWQTLTDTCQVAGWGTAAALRKLADRLDPPPRVIDAIHVIGVSETVGGLSFEFRQDGQ
jgi:hypothetical protein